MVPYWSITSCMWAYMIGFDGFINSVFLMGYQFQFFFVILLLRTRFRLSVQKLSVQSSMFPSIQFLLHGAMRLLCYSSIQRRARWRWFPWEFQSVAVWCCVINIVTNETKRALSCQPRARRRWFSSEMQSVVVWCYVINIVTKVRKEEEFDFSFCFCYWVLMHPKLK